MTYITPYPRAKFIESHRGAATSAAASEFDTFVLEIPRLVSQYESWDGGGERLISHKGGVTGFTSELHYWPNQDITTIILANQEESARTEMASHRSPDVMVADMIPLPP